MEKIQIFVEGDADARFIEQFIGFYFKQNPPITKLGGKATLGKIAANFQLAETNIVFADADFSPTPKDANFKEKAKINGFENTIKYFEQQQIALNISFSLFLFPNNKDDGNLETLLLKLIPEDKLPIIRCFDKQRECFDELYAGELNLPSTKTQLYAYCDLQFQKGRETERNYLLPELWTLQNTENEYVKTLLDFLTLHFLA